MDSVPDDIVQHILSFLDTKEAIQNSVVSSTWRHLWLSLPSLNIDSDSFHSYSSFSNFVLTILHARSQSRSPLTHCKFWFHVSNPIYSSIEMSNDLTNTVIHHAIANGVQHLSLLLPRILHHLPLLFSCQSLASLQLYHLHILPTFFGFSTLTTLHLVQCSFMMNFRNSLDPFKGFVSLTNLFISDCRIPFDFKIFHISAPQLSNLTISNMEHIGSVSPECKIVISSTKITSFHFIDSHILEFSVASFHSIQTVYIDIPEIFYLLDYVHLINMFRAFGDAKTVILSFRTLSILSLFPDALRHPSPFTGMKILKVKVPHEPCPITIPVDVITFLLNGSPARDYKVEFIKQVPSRSTEEN